MVLLLTNPHSRVQESCHQNKRYSYCPPNSKGFRIWVLNIPITQKIMMFLGGLYIRNQNQRVHVKMKYFPSGFINKGFRSSVWGTRAQDQNTYFLLFHHHQKLLFIHINVYQYWLIRNWKNVKILTDLNIINFKITVNLLPVNIWENTVKTIIFY